MRSDRFDEQEGRELMEAILIALTLFESEPEKLPEIIAGLAATA